MRHDFKSIAVLLVVLASCQKEEPFMNSGVITGFDTKKCPCCGGLVINFRGEQQSYTGNFT
jgi:hypothetical protein